MVEGGVGVGEGDGGGDGVGVAGEAGDGWGGGGGGGVFGDGVGVGGRGGVFGFGFVGRFVGFGGFFGLGAAEEARCEGGRGGVEFRCCGALVEFEALGADGCGWGDLAAEGGGVVVGFERGGSDGEVAG